jgi:hypothetical protein
MRAGVQFMIAVALVAGGCAAGTLTSPSPGTESPIVQPCATAAIGYSGRVVASYVTTVGAIRAMALNAHHSDLWPDITGDHAAVLCYIDGSVAKGPPGLAAGTEPPTYDRAVVAVINGKTDLIAAGYRDNLPAVAP